MDEVGKQINPNQGPFVNHEGLKRVYKPKVRAEKNEEIDKELELINQISESQTENLKFIESLKEFIDPNGTQDEPPIAEAEEVKDELKAEEQIVEDPKAAEN